MGFWGVVRDCTVERRRWNVVKPLVPLPFKPVLSRGIYAILMK